MRAEARFRNLLKNKGSYLYTLVAEVIEFIGYFISLIHKKMVDKKLVVYNNTVNSFEHRQICLVTDCELDVEEALIYSKMIHENGKHTAKAGEINVLKRM